MLRALNSVYRISYIVYRILPILASGILLSLSFLTLNLSFLAFVALVPLLFAIERPGPKRAFFISYFTGLLFFLLSMYWLIYVTPAGWMLLCLYQALYVGIFGLFCPYLLKAHYAPPGCGLRSQLTAYVSVPTAWCILEYLRSHIGGGIGWNLLGYSQYQNIPVIQIADITGVYGVSFLIVLLNFTIFSGIKMAINCQRTHRRLFAKSDLTFREEIKLNPLLQTFIVLLTAVCVMAYGYVRITALDRGVSSSAKRLKVSVIQGNIEQLNKWAPSHKDSIMKKYKGLTLEAARDRPQLIIWPETSVPGYVNEDRPLLEQIQDLTRMAKTLLLVGAPAIAKKGAEEIGDYNSAILFSKKGRLLQRYDKLHLVLFGEYIPLERHLPFLRGLLPLTGNFIPGEEFTVFRLTASDLQLTINFSVLICFEDIFPDMVRRFVKEGADFMVNMTNDAWFGKSAAAYQHAANSVFRAVENRRPFVRSANTGFSCFIDRAGRIYDRVSSKGEDLFIDGFRTNNVDILPDGYISFYTIFGDIFILFCSFITALFLIDYLRRRRYNKNLS